MRVEDAESRLGSEYTFLPTLTGSFFQNSIPTANDDTSTVSVGRSTTINIGANDTDANNDELTTTAFTNPSKGTVVYNNNIGSADTVTYTPLSNASGFDVFSYQVSDGNGGTDTALISVTIENTLDVTPPVLHSFSSNITPTVTGSQPITITYTASDDNAGILGLNFGFISERDPVSGSFTAFSTIDLHNDSDSIDGTHTFT